MAIVAIALAVTLGSTARADVIIEASVDGGAFVTLTSNASNPSGPASVSFTGPIPGGVFNVVGSIAVTGTQGSPPPTGNQGTSKLTITQQVSGTHTLEIITSVNNYTQPSGPATASSSETGTVGTATNGSIAYNAYQSNTNTLGAKTNLIVTGTQSADTTSGGTSTLAPPNKGSTTLTVTTPYSLTMDELITLHGAGQTINATGNTSVVGTTVVPEPGTVALALTGLPMLIGGVWLRRRRRAQG
jgi:hypothetical protein